MGGVDIFVIVGICLLATASIYIIYLLREMLAEARTDRFTKEQKWEEDHERYKENLKSFLVEIAIDRLSVRQGIFCDIEINNSEHRLYTSRLDDPRYVGYLSLIPLKHCINRLCDEGAHSSIDGLAALPSTVIDKHYDSGREDSEFAYKNYDRDTLDRVHRRLAWMHPWILRPGEVEDILRNIAKEASELRRERIGD